MHVRFPKQMAAVFTLGVLAGFSGAAGAAAGSAEAGKAQSAACAACHGQDGATPLDPTYPLLAGQNARYLSEQLALIQSNAPPFR